MGPGIRAVENRKIKQVDVSELTASQKINFRNIDIDWDAASQKVRDLIDGQSVLGSYRSQHYELFAGLAQVVKPNRILEIGTADASFTQFLSKVFPQASIETIDLPTSDDRFWNAQNTNMPKSATLEADLNELKMRDKRISESPNVKFLEMNSLSLSRFESEKYDLIWVDGDHTFPVVACDIANAVRLLKSDGFLVCDDLYLSRGRQGIWGSQESKDVLDAFASAGVLSTKFILKSLRPEKNFGEKMQKYVSVSRLV